MMLCDATGLLSRRIQSNSVEEYSSSCFGIILTKVTMKKMQYLCIFIISNHGYTTTVQ